MSQTQISDWKFLIGDNLGGFSLLIPTVAVGNVAQLACDLLISSFEMKKIASMYSSAFIPVVGYDPYNLTSGNLSTSCEVYKSNSKKLIVLQMRAPLICRYEKAFLEEVVQIFKEKKVKEIIILTSSWAHEKKHISTSSFRYVAGTLCKHKSMIGELGWIEHENDNGAWKIHGGGSATLLFEICEKADVPCLILFKYCSEGDNIPDAYDMISHLCDLLPLFSDKNNLYSKLIQPVSWKLLFGPPPPQDIY